MNNGKCRLMSVSYSLKGCSSRMNLFLNTPIPLKHHGAAVFLTPKCGLTTALLLSANRTSTMRKEVDNFAKGSGMINSN